MKNLVMAVTAVLSFWTFASKADPNPEGSLTIRGRLAPGLKIESIEASYSSEWKVNGPVIRKGRVAMKKDGSFTAALKYKQFLSAILPGTNAVMTLINIQFSHKKKEFGHDVIYRYKQVYLVDDHAKPVRVGGVAISCGSQTFVGYEQSCWSSLQTTARPNVSFGFSENVIDNAKIDLVETVDPVLDESRAAHTYIVPDWKMTFVVYKNDEGEVGPGSLLRVIARSDSKMAAGLYRISQIEDGRSHVGVKAPYDLSGSFFLLGSWQDNGVTTYFRFAPHGAINSFYDDCKPMGPKANLLISDRVYDYEHSSNSCAYTPTIEH